MDYKKSVIYKIYCKDTDVKDFYIGSTKDMKTRKQAHKDNCNNENSKGYNIYLYQFIREHNGWNNWNMVEIEEYPCVDRTELEQRERYWYDELKPSLNMIKPYVSSIEKIEQKKECDKNYYENNKDKLNAYNKENYEKNKENRKEHMKEWREKNKDIIREKKKEYYEKNKDEINEKNKEYRIRNKDKMKEYFREYNKKNTDKKRYYYEKNKDKIEEKRKEYRKIKYKCECGSIVKLCTKARHLRTKKHIQFMNSKNLNI